MSLHHNNILDWPALSQAFLELHQQDGFVLLPASSMLHDSVPMSFVMSAGLIQVENELERIVQETGGRFAFTQPCFRHFDLSQVATDSTHLSLFHMSAAFHIGSSQRDTVLPRLWYFLTQILGLETDKLWISYLDDPQLGRDEATYECWRKLGVSAEHLVGLDQEYCFWRQRSLGQIASDGKKCGPHTEVFYQRPTISCEKCNVPSLSLGQCRCGRFVEVANTLFIENYLSETAELLPADVVFAECVVGLERLAMILQKQPDVYHIHRFQDWRDQLLSMLSISTAEQHAAINLILDHLSAFVELVADGAPAPGRGGRARIMRNLTRGALTQMVLYDWPVEQILTRLLSEDKLQHNLQMLQLEYNLFAQTLQRGKRKLFALIEQNKFSDSAKLSLEKEWGIPPVLLNKYQQEYFANSSFKLKCK